VTVTADPDRPLVERTLAGEIEAFEDLVSRHRDVVYRVAARVVGREAAQDVSQDAFLRAFHKLPDFKGQSPFRSWLLRITHNTALNTLARRVPEPVGVSTDIESAHPAPPTERPPVDTIEEGERRRRLELKLGELRPEHRAVLVLRDLEELSYDEIADVTGTPLGSVKGRLHRARGEMIDILRHNTYDWDLPRG